MTYDRYKHHRRSIRLKEYDYGQAGAYFVTMCVDGGLCLLGEIVDGAMELNWRGHIAAGTWLWLAEQYDHVELDVWQVMPNHFHGILVLTDAGTGRDDAAVGAVREPPLRQHAEPPPHTGSTVSGESDVPRDLAHAADSADADTRDRKPKPLGRLIGAFKTVCTAQINRMQDTQGARFWQRDFYDRVIRDEGELERIRTYIYNNPAAWDADRLHPDAPPNRFTKGWR